MLNVQHREHYIRLLCRWHSLQVLDRGLTIFASTAIRVDSGFPGTRVLLEELDLFTVHMLRDLISLPFLEAKTDAFMRVVLVVGLILVVLNLDKVRVDGGGIKREGDEGVDGGGFGNELECP